MEYNTKCLSKSAQSVQDVLSKKGLPLNVIELAASTRTAYDASLAIGCDVAQIIKSLIFRTKDTHQPILLLVSGVNRVDETVIEEYIGEKIVKADAEFTREVTGFAIGGVPPVGHKKLIATYIDADLLHYVQVWAAAGTPHAVFSVPSSELVELTGGQIINVCTKR